MATIPDSIKAQLDADWTAAGGAEPAYYVSEDFTLSAQPPQGEDFIWIISKSLKTDPEPVNDTYTNYTHTIDIITNTSLIPNGADRLKEISDEVERILNATTIADINWQKISGREIVTPETLMNHKERIQVTMEAFLVVSGSAYGPGTTGDFAVVGDLTVGGDADITGDLELGGELVMDGAVLHGTGSDFHMHPSTGNVAMNLLLHPLGTEDESSLKLRTSVSANYGEFKMKIDGTNASLESNQGGSGTTPDTLNINDAGWDTINVGDASATVNVKGYDIGAALMLGSANAAWVPLSLETAYTAVTNINAASHVPKNKDATDDFLLYNLPLPPVKGSLKLYVVGVRIVLSDADATNHITGTWVTGANSSGSTSVYNNVTDRATVDTHDNAFGAVDMSSYNQVRATLHMEVDTGGALDIAAVAVSCYYA